MIQIDFKILQAAIIVAPKQDVRYYLNGVLVEHDRVVATDGHRLITIPFKSQGEAEPFIIPREAIERLHKQLSAHQRKTGVVNITITPKDDQAMSELECEFMFSKFNPIDGKYPEWRRVVPTLKAREDREPHARFNWDYMADFNKIAKILSPGIKDPEVDMHPDGNNSALVTFPQHIKDVQGVIMPMRIKTTN